MLNIFSLICICLNSALHSISFVFAKLPEAYAFLNPIVEVYASHTCALFALSPCLASCCKFLMIFLRLSYQHS